jgi:hypothetical protein
MTDVRFFQEAQRLRLSSMSGTTPGGLGTVQFTADCPGDATEVIQRAKEVMLIVSERTISGWPSNDEWKRTLPSWFLAECAPLKTREESDRFMEWWRGLSPEEQARAEREEAWSLDAWLHWMSPDNRCWTWWDARTNTMDTAIVAVEVKDWPFPWGALRWLFRAAGARSLDAEM